MFNEKIEINSPWFYCNSEKTIYTGSLQYHKDPSGLTKKCNSIHCFNRHDRHILVIYKKDLKERKCKIFYLSCFNRTISNIRDAQKEEINLFDNCQHDFIANAYRFPDYILEAPNFRQLEAIEDRNKRFHLTKLNRFHMKINLGLSVNTCLKHFTMSDEIKETLDKLYFWSR